MTQKELQKLWKTIEFKEANGIDTAEDQAKAWEEFFRMCAEKGIEEPVTSIGFIGTDREKIDFFKERFNHIYNKLSPNLYENPPDIIERFINVYCDLSISCMEAADYRIADETDDPIFTETGLIIEYGIDIVRDYHECKERAAELFDYIYRYMPYIIGTIEDEDTVVEFYTTVFLTMDSAFMVFETYYNVVKGLR